MEARLRQGGTLGARGHDQVKQAVTHRPGRRVDECRGLLSEGAEAAIAVLPAVGELPQVVEQLAFAPENLPKDRLVRGPAMKLRVVIGL